MSVQGQLSDIFSFIIIIESIDGSYSALPRKRKERDEDERPSQSSFLPQAPTSQSNLENLESHAAAAARTISKLLGGETWKSQSIEKLGMVQSRSHQSLRALHGAVQTSLQIPQVATAEAGSFNSELVEALTSAYSLRISNPKKHAGGDYLKNLSLLDYEKANELLKGKIRQDGE